METLNIGIDSWIIQDGNYNDFSVGQETSFAIEFYPKILQMSACNSPEAVNIKENLYKFCGQIIYLADNVWVLDIGFLVYQEAAPPDFATKESFLEGEIYLGVDPYFYSEYLYKMPNMPALKYKFKVEQILLETTPWIEQLHHTGTRELFRDKEKESFEKIDKTNSRTDDNGHAGYILTCLPL